MSTTLLAFSSSSSSLAAATAVTAAVTIATPSPDTLAATFSSTELPHLLDSSHHVIHSSSYPATPSTPVLILASSSSTSVGDMIATPTHLQPLQPLQPLQQQQQQLPSQPHQLYMPQDPDIQSHMSMIETNDKIFPPVTYSTQTLVTVPNTMATPVDSSSSDEHGEETETSEDEQSTHVNTTTASPAASLEPANSTWVLPLGHGDQLLECDHIANEIESRSSSEKVLQQFFSLLFPGASLHGIKQALKGFNGFPLAEQATVRTRMVSTLTSKTWDLQCLRELLQILGLERSGQKGLLADRITDFLLNPDTSKVHPRKKRTVKAKDMKEVNEVKEEKPARAPRSRSAFDLFKAAVRIECKEQLKGMPFGEISGFLSKKWKELESDKRAEFQATADSLKKEKALSPSPVSPSLAPYSKKRKSSSPSDDVFKLAPKKQRSTSPSGSVDSPGDDDEDDIRFCDESSYDSEGEFAKPQQAEPSESLLRDAIQRFLVTKDIETTTPRMVRHHLASLFPSVPLETRQQRNFIKHECTEYAMRLFQTSATC